MSLGEEYRRVRARLTAASDNFANVGDYSPTTQERVLREVAAASLAVENLYRVRSLQELQYMPEASQGNHAIHAAVMSIEASRNSGVHCTSAFRV